MSAVTVSSTGAINRFKEMTTATSGVLARFPWLLPVRNSFASYGASAVTRTSDRGHVAEAKKTNLNVALLVGQWVLPGRQNSVRRGRKPREKSKSTKRCGLDRLNLIYLRVRRACEGGAQSDCSIRCPGAPHHLHTSCVPRHLHTVVSTGPVGVLRVRRACRYSTTLI